MMQFMLLFSRQGKLRLQKWYVAHPDKLKKKITRELITTVLARKPKMCSFLEWKDVKVVYKRYASLYFCCAMEQEDNELLTLELIHRYVELLDKYFGSVCELDIIFNFEKAYFILDELVLGGELQETSKKNVLKAIAAQDLLQEKEIMKLCKQCPKAPVVSKCCFCVPIRKGVTIFGYVNLVLSLLSFPLLIFLLVEQVATGKAVETDGHMDPLVHLPLTIGFVAIDVAMTIVLLVGAHKKKRVLLQVYFYFGVGFQLFTLCMDLVYFDYREYVENTVYFVFLGLNVYLLFLVYSTIRVIDQPSEVQYVAYENQQQA